MLPPQPATPSPTTPPEMPWRWRFEDAAGVAVSASDFAEARFASQADAESWVGEAYGDLAAAGVDAVTLLEYDREVYGPMSLHA